MANQNEDLHELLSDTLKDVIYWKNMYVTLDGKFKEYVTKSERYIKDKDTKLQEVQAEIQDMSYKYKNHGKIYDQEKARANQYEQMYNDLKKPYDDIKKEAHRLKLNLIKYEEKYKFIDIAQLHAESMRAIAQCEAAQKQAASYKKDLMDIRKKILEVTQKAEGGKKKKKKEEEEWRGPEDVEKLCIIFTNYLTAPAATYPGPGKESEKAKSTKSKKSGANEG